MTVYPNSQGCVAAEVLTTNLSGIATLTYPDPGFIPKLQHEGRLTDGTSVHVTVLSVTNTQAQLKVNTTAVVSVLGIDVLGVALAASRNIWVAAFEP